MSRLYFMALAIFLACLVLATGDSLADEGANAGSAKKIRVLVLVGGHSFPEKPFRAIFDGFADMNCTVFEEKKGGEAFENIDNWPYDAVVLYNHAKNPSEKQRENFLKLMDRGVGLVVLHHGIHAYQRWPEFRKIVGVTSWVSQTKDDVNYTIHIEDPKHPIVQGMSDFAVKDETYRGHQIDPRAKVRVFLTTNEPGNFKAVAWTLTYRKSPVCFLQLGHGESVYGQKEFQAVLGNAIRWSAGRLIPAEKTTR